MPFVESFVSWCWTQRGRDIIVVGQFKCGMASEGLDAPSPRSDVTVVCLAGSKGGRKSAMQLESTLTCPQCGHQAVEAMPIDACQFFYECKGCGAILKPLAGDCCVFCSYGSVPRPPVREALANGASASRCGAK